MAIKRRLKLGGALQGLGEGLSNYAGMQIKRKALDDQRAYDTSKDQQTALDALLSHLNPEALDAAAINPRFAGMNFGPMRNVAAKQGAEQFTSALNTAASPEAMPADLGTALAAKTGKAFPSLPMASLPGSSQFGAQMDNPDLPPELNAAMNAASSRLGQLNKAKEDALTEAGQKKYTESNMGAQGTNDATAAFAPTARGIKVADATAMGPVDATNAGLTTGAQHRAALAPDIVKGEAAAAGANAGAVARAQLETELSHTGLSKQQQTAALQLADDFRTESAPFRIQENSFRSILTASKDPSAAGDLSIIFAYMKLLDPPSSVREGEQATASNAVGVPAQVRNWFNRVQTGERLAPEQRADFVKQAFGIYDSAKKGQSRIVGDYMQRATQYGVPPSLVVREADPSLAEPPKPAPMAGSSGSKYDVKMPPR